MKVEIDWLSDQTQFTVKCISNRNPVHLERILAELANWQTLRLFDKNQNIGAVPVVLGFNDTSTLVGHFVSSPREREKRDRRDSRRDEREDREERRKRNKSESEETEKIKTFPFYPYLLQG